MVFDRLTDARTYSGLSPRLRRALQHLASTDWSACDPGRYDIEGSQLFALVADYDTRPSAEVPWEAHRQYIDVQYVHAGVEYLGHAHLSTLSAGEYDASRDLLPATGTGLLVALAAGSFAILWPHDAHRPGVAVDGPRHVRKVVLKVAVDDGAL